MISRKIAISLVTIVSALALTAGGTFALFSSEASNPNNSFSSGNLTLLINTAGGSLSTPVFNVSGIAPGQKTSRLLTLKNNGSVPASSVNVNGISINSGETAMAGAMTVEFFNDADSDGVQDLGETVLGTATMDNSVWNTYVLPGVTLGAGLEYPLGISITLNSDASNDFQGKSINFNIGLKANQ